MNLVLSKCEADDLFSFTVRVAICVGMGGSVRAVTSLHVGIPLDITYTMYHKARSSV